MKYIFIYYIAINIVLFLLMALDKRRAIKHKYRIKEATLLTLSLVGGGLGGFIGMLTFRHKTRKKYFSFVFLISIAAHAVAIYHLFFIK